jgi:glycine/D-amino acid oxidase-like deaminating enzyme
MNVAVVGGGIFGQVIAWRLAIRGHRVALIEPVGPGNAGSGSGDRSRIVRALYDDRGFAAAGHLGLALWSAWSRELGARLVEPTGVVYFDRAGDDEAATSFRAWLDRGVANVRDLGGIAEEIAPDEAARRWPGVATRDLARVVLELAGGFGRPALACRTIARASLSTGLVEPRAATAERVATRGASVAGIVVRERDLSTRVIEADAVVVAAGFAGVALVSEFAGDLGIRRLPHWTSYWDVPYPEGASLGLDRLPVWADLGAAMYGFPDDGESGFKMAWHEPRGGASELDRGSHAADGAPTPAQVEALREAATTRFPGLRAATYRGSYACAYDATPDEMFQVGAVPGVEGLYFVGGMSGHGFKHAPSLGESVAQLVSGEATALDLGPYRLRT